MQSNKLFYHIFLFIPVICALLSMRGYGSFMQAGVSATCALIIAFFCRKEIRKTCWLLIIGLLISIAGGWMMKHRSGSMQFVFAISLYFAAHICFLVFCLLNGKIQKRWLFVLLAGYGIFFISTLFPAIKERHLSAAVFFYTMISCFSLAAAPGLRLPILPRILFTIGIACLVFSDTLIAVYVFLHTGKEIHNLLMMPAYYLSHIFITAAVIRTKHNEIKET